MLFKYPSYVSNTINFPDVLNVIFLLPSSLRTLKENEMIKSPYKFVKKLSIQQDLGPVAQSVLATAAMAADVSETTMIVAIILTVLLTGIMMQLWTLVNSLQIISSFTSINMPMPALVYLVQDQLSKLDCLDFVPTS